VRQLRELRQQSDDRLRRHHHLGRRLQIWPPLTTTAATVVVGKGLTASLFKMVGSAKIVAIAGHPLYRFSGDAKAGDTKGEGFGGVWHVAGPVGNTM